MNIIFLTNYKKITLIALFKLQGREMFFYRTNEKFKDEWTKDSRVRNFEMNTVRTSHGRVTCATFYFILYCFI